MTKPLILIADDDKALLQMLAVRFDRHGYRTITAVNGGDALALACDDAPDVMLLDINMPERGLDVHRRKRKFPDLQEVPVIYMTGENSERVHDAAKNLGAFAVVPKPLDFWQLLDVVASALEASGCTRVAAGQSKPAID